MIRWCSFCQHLIGEIPPLNAFEITHGICEECARNIETYDPDSSVLRAKALFDALQDAVHSGDFERCFTAIDEAMEAGLKPSEILIGALQPALGRIGQLWESGSVTVAEEHRFTRFATDVISRLRHRQPSSEQPLVLLAPFEDNAHDVGLSLLQHLAWERDIACLCLPVGTGVVDIRSCVERLRPNLVGLSVSLVETLPAAVNFARRLSGSIPQGSELVLGGQAFRHGESSEFPADLPVLVTVDQFIDRLKRLADTTRPKDHERQASS